MSDSKVQVNHEKKPVKKITWFTTYYPIPVLALVGLVIGIVLQVTHAEQAGKIAWTITLQLVEFQ